MTFVGGYMWIKGPRFVIEATPLSFLFLPNAEGPTKGVSLIDPLRRELAGHRQTTGKSWWFEGRIGLPGCCGVGAGCVAALVKGGAMSLQSKDTKEE